MCAITKDGAVNGHVRQFDTKQGYALLDRQTKRILGITAAEFIDAWREGKFRDEDEYPEAVRLAMMIPLAT